MCDLLGLSFNTPVTAKISLDVFQQRGEMNPDGWGVAFYNDNRIQVIKEAEPAVNSRLFDFIEQYPQSQTFITHVRRSTRGARSYLNTHPFYRLHTSGFRKREFAFAHNGTLIQQEKLKLKQFSPIGETDSEHAFCFILDAISSRGIEEWKNDDFEFVEYVLRDINDGLNTLNCIFSDGEHIFCYSDENDHNNGLRFVKQTHPFGSIELTSQDEKLGSIDIQSDSKEQAQTGYIISTRILTKELWTEFEGGELIVFKHGKIVYPHERVQVDAYHDDRR
ncbi:MAG: class II glutamine amidotransferase [Candidatus Thorarchaeota archaeon]|jgi:glutamine amidotransferase